MGLSIQIMGQITVQVDTSREKKAQDISVAAKDTVLDSAGVSNKAFCWS